MCRSRIPCVTDWVDETSALRATAQPKLDYRSPTLRHGFPEVVEASPGAIPYGISRSESRIDERPLELFDVLLSTSSRQYPARMSFISSMIRPAIPRRNPKLPHSGRRFPRQGRSPPRAARQSEIATLPAPLRAPGQIERGRKPPVAIMGDQGVISEVVVHVGDQRIENHPPRTPASSPSSASGASTSERDVVAPRREGASGSRPGVHLLLMRRDRLCGAVRSAHSPPLRTSRYRRVSPRRQTRRCLRRSGR